MHKIALSPVIVERIKARRGGVHAFPTVIPKTTALLVVDMQNGFCKQGEVTFVETAPEIVPAINRIAGALRAAGGLVVWIQLAATRESIASWSVFYDELVPNIRGAMIGALTPGTAAYELWPELDVRPVDLRSVKTRFSALFPGASDLDFQLRLRGIDTVLVTGTVTNVCCESTARDANMLNYRTIFIADANAARSDEEHNATLNAILNNQGDVRTTDEIVALIETARRNSTSAQS